MTTPDDPASELEEDYRRGALIARFIGEVKHLMAEHIVSEERAEGMALAKMDTEDQYIISRWLRSSRGNT